ncbi:MAG: T9SS type A sorting domain-containing protein [Flavobacteriaceae bacterium]|nr:T9SS type A sorting domain-containing protein [Flavobacteriaceae bacterium]
MKRVYTIVLSLLAICLHAQYTTPNNGEVFTLHDLTLTEPAVVVLSNINEFTLNGDLTISENDTLLIDEDITLKISPEVLITVFGTFHTMNEGIENPLIITAVDPTQPYSGFRMEQGSSSHFERTIFEYGGGFRVFSENFEMHYCTVRYMSEGVSTSAAISFSRGAPVISNTHFFMNDLPAVASGANQTVAAKLRYNIIEKNGQSNENRPQINLAASGIQDTIVLIGNQIIGDRSKEMTGGIAIANFFSSPNHVIIRDNNVYDNRYGLTLFGPNLYALVENNIFRDNNTQNDPMAGGSGINLYSAGDEINTNTIIRENEITGNLWGITLQGNAFANLGDGSEESPGQNTFDNNVNNDIIYALFNNTANTLPAQNNCWIAGQESTQEEVENVIFHEADDSSLGWVDYSNFNCNLAVNDINSSIEIIIYPNPAREFVMVKSDADAQFELYNSTGKLLKTQRIQAGTHQIDLNFQKGIYFIRIDSNGKINHKKLLIK